jgi:hypothetical protein
MAKEQERTERMEQQRKERELKNQQALEVRLDSGILEIINSYKVKKNKKQCPEFKC